jgi:hypothetical protein
MPNTLIQLLSDKRHYLVEEYLRLMQHKGESKYLEDDDDTARARAEIVIDKLIESVQQNDLSIIKKQIAIMAQERINEGYADDAIVLAWEWGHELFVRLVNENLADDPKKAEYLRTVNTLSKTARLVVAEYHLNHLKHS